MERPCWDSAAPPWSVLSIVAGAFCLSAESSVCTQSSSLWLAAFRAVLSSDTSTLRAAISLLSSETIEELAVMEHAEHTKEEAMVA